MVLVKKFLLLSIFLTSLTFSATEDSKRTFLQLYYSGKYAEAHSLLSRINPATRQIWEERLHIHENISDCNFQSDDSRRAAAFLRIGLINQAKSNFQQDWLSFLGRAKLAGWSNDLDMARAYLSKAMRIKPDNPDLFFYAGLYASNNEEAVNYFQKYLESNATDALKRNSAKQTIEFIQKTKGLDLNQSNLSSSVETIDSDFAHRKLTIRAKINENNEVVLLMDTGASGLSLKDKNWKARSMTDLMMIGLGVKQRTKAALVVFEEFSAGKFRMKNPVAAVSRTLEGTGIDGIAGAIVFSRYSIVLPLRNDSNVILSTLESDPLLTHLEQNGLKFKQKVTLPFYQVGKMIILKGAIKKSDGEMDILLDTGAQTSILSAAAARKHVRINYPKTFREKRKTYLMGIGGKIQNLIHVENVEIEVGSLRKTFNRMVASNLAQISEAIELEVDLILGQDFLNGYTLIIDYRNNLVTFLS
jgi:tetratricopeptide (TPR) repeat protein